MDKKYAIFLDGYKHAGHILAEIVLERSDYDVQYLTHSDAAKFARRNPHCEVLLIGFGGEKYDTNGSTAINPLNGFPYSLFGLVWADFGRHYIECASKRALSDERTKLIFEDISKTFLPTVDGQERGIRPIFQDRPHRVFTLSDSLALISNGSWDGHQSVREYAASLLDAVVRDSERSFEKRADFDDALSSSTDRRVVVLDEYIKYHGFIHEEQYKDILYLIFPTVSDDGYNIIAVIENGVPRKPLPSHWVTSGNKELGVTSCHEGRYIASTKTKQEAIMAAYYAAYVENE